MCALLCVTLRVSKVHNISELVAVHCRRNACPNHVKVRIAGRCCWLGVAEHLADDN
jgi:hypothetical protein